MKATFRKSFARDLRKVKSQPVRERVLAAIANVEAATNLRAIRNLKKLSGTGDYYRIRVGDYRIGLAIEGDIVDFVRCLPRQDLYRFFP
jgi:mRNA interferase RelE/StbE